MGDVSGTAVERQESVPLSDEYIRARVAEMKWYAPIDFGGGIAVRPWNWPDAPLNTPQMGAARFEFMLRRNLPDLQGLRVLDLGCNAGVMCIHMARCGAREVVGIDSDATWQGWREQALFLKRVLEWRCQTHYNTRYVECDMRNVPELDLGRFDVVMALCSIYYIEDEAVARLVRHFASISDVLLLQGNTIRTDHVGYWDVKRRAHPKFLRQVLAENGFPFVTVDDPWWYGRPVVVGRKSPSPSNHQRGLKPGLKRALGRVASKLRMMPYRFCR